MSQSIRSTHGFGLSQMLSVVLQLELCTHASCFQDKCARKSQMCGAHAGSAGGVQTQTFGQSALTQFGVDVCC